MEGSSKESEMKDNPSPPKNIVINSESKQQNCSQNNKTDRDTDNETSTSTLLNNESNGCDIQKPLNTVSQLGDSKSESADHNHEVTEMEMGSPEKQLNPMNDSQKTSAVKGITGNPIYGSANNNKLCLNQYAPIQIIYNLVNIIIIFPKKKIPILKWLIYFSRTIKYKDRQIRYKSQKLLFLREVLAVKKQILASK